MGRKKSKKTGIVLYFILLILLISLLIIHAFRIYPVESGFFTRYLVALIFASMLLPLVPKIKIFDIIDVKRETRMFRNFGKKK